MPGSPDMLILPARLTHEVVMPVLSAMSDAQKSHAAVVIDASALQEFDSSALAVLLACRRQALAVGKSFSVQGLPQRLRQLAGLYGVAELLAVGA
jgi:phospholipid transport system transporter-binding protein